jgi:hypothetical protein
VVDFASMITLQARSRRNALDAATRLRRELEQADEAQRMLAAQAASPNTTTRSWQTPERRVR